MNESIFNSPFAIRVSLGLVIVNCIVPVYLYSKTNIAVFIASWLASFTLFSFYSESRVLSSYISLYRLKVLLLTLTPTFALYTKLVLKMSAYDKFTKPLFVIGILSLSCYIFYAYKISKKKYEERE